MMEEAVDSEMVKILVDAGVEIELLKYVKRKRINTVKFLVESGVDIRLFIKEEYYDDIVYCALENCPEIFKYFLTLPYVDINKHYNYYGSLLHIAIMKRNKDMCLLCVESGINLNIVARESRTPLCCAVSSNLVEICYILINARDLVPSRRSDEHPGANVNEGNPIYFAKNEIIKNVS